MSPYQNLYWQSQELCDEIFRYERLIARCKRQGKVCVKYEREYHLLIDELRTLQSRLNLYDRCA